MPEKGDKEALEKAREDLAEGKASTTAAGEFVREEIHHVREGKHGARSPKQAIAIGLSKARRAGMKLPPPAAGKVSPEAKRKAEQDIARRRKHKRSRFSRTIRSACTGQHSRWAIARQFTLTPYRTRRTSRGPTLTSPSGFGGGVAGMVGLAGADACRGAGGTTAGR